MVKHFLLIVVDCLRADHVSALGYHRETTPTLDELAESGICWTNARSVSSWTKPSVCSLLTGCYPREHGAVRGVKRSKSRERATSDLVSDRTTTLAERFSEAGFRCGAFINNVQLHDYSGIARGFSYYNAEAGKADRLISLVDDWIRASPREPWFAYLHFLEAHWPYKPRRRHVEMFGGNRDTNPYTGFSARDFGRLRKSLHRGEVSLTPRDGEDMMVMYDAAVRRLDGKLRGLLKLLRSLKLESETAIFVTADHGEEFLDHGSIGHGHTLYDELIHVPLIAYLPQATGGVRIDDPVSHVDVAPTLLGLADVESTSPRRDLTDVRGVRSPVVSELVIRDKVTEALTTEGWKYFRRLSLNRSWCEVADGDEHETPSRPSPDRVALYDLSGDPKERHNLADSEANRLRAARMAGELDEWRRRYQPVSDADSGEVVVDDRVVQRLRDLGYVD